MSSIVALVGLLCLVAGAAVVFLQLRAGRVGAGAGGHAGEDDLFVPPRNDRSGGWASATSLADSLSADKRAQWTRRMDEALDLAGFHLPAASVVGGVAAACVVAAVAGLVLIGPLGVLVLGGLPAVVVVLLVRARMAKRRSAFALQLPDTLGLIAASLRAGISLPQAMASVAADAPEPTADEFQRVVSEIRLGLDLTVALRNLGERMDSADMRWAIGAIEIHRDIGGDLAEVLDRVVETVRSRNRVKNQIQILTAEGRLSAWILGLLPPVMLVVISFLNPGYIRELTGRPLGWVLLGIGAFLLTSGMVWMRRMTRLVF
ncbi:MAG: type II secretion system protein F [Acidimicrobiia bacterium]|nr:type II secretion system protein F [Acidimicrobiia bacterium]